MNIPAGNSLFWGQDGDTICRWRYTSHIHRSLYETNRLHWSYAIWARGGGLTEQGCHALCLKNNLTVKPRLVEYSRVKINILHVSRWWYQSANRHLEGNSLCSMKKFHVKLERGSSSRALVIHLCQWLHRLTAEATQARCEGLAPPQVAAGDATPWRPPLLVSLQWLVHQPTLNESSHWEQFSILRALPLGDLPSSLPS